jgi:hypothetical protein
VFDRDPDCAGIRPVPGPAMGARLIAADIRGLERAFIDFGD